jgi:hypothetical protein
MMSDLYVLKILYEEWSTIPLLWQWRGGFGEVGSWELVSWWAELVAFGGKLGGCLFAHYRPSTCLST